MPSCVDLATTYHVVGLCNSHKPAHVAQVLLDTWITPFGMPGRLCIDQDGAFKSVFQDSVEQLGAFVQCSAGQAPWQHGVCERQGGWLKEIARRTGEATTPIGAEDMKLLMTGCCNAKNTLRRKAGYSPAQWVFRAEPRLVADFMEEPHLLTTMNTPAGAMARRMQMRTEARAAFVRIQTCATLRRAMLSRTRPRRAGWAAGEYVFWWRRPHGPARPGMWKGRGVVIGSHEGNHWVSTAG